MTPPRRLVWLAEVPFAGHPHRQPHLARRLARSFEVLFVEPPPPLRPPKLATLVRDGVRVAQVAPLLNARPRPLRWLLARPLARRLAAWLGARQLSGAVRRAGWQAPRGDLVVVCSSVYLADAALALRPAALVVDLCDDPRHYPGEPPWTHELLVRAVRSATLVTTSSRSLADDARSLGARRVDYVPNGIRASLLRPLQPEPRAPVTGVVGFVGYLGPWVDFDLLDALAAALPDATIELTGPVDPAVSADAARLRRRCNVRFTGPVSEEEVPRAIARFGVCLIPFRVSAYTRAVNPIKLYEYAAQNLPIVSTAFSPDVAQFREWVDVCETADEFIRAVRARAGGGRPAQTRWIAETHTWEAIAERFAQLVDRAGDAPWPGR